MATEFDWRSRMVGLDLPAPLVDRAPNPTSTSTTPPARRRFVTWRGDRAFPSLLFERASGLGLQVAGQHGGVRRSPRIVARFVGADTRDEHGDLRQEHDRSDQQARLPLPADWPSSVVLSTEMEHHSNDLPWRRATMVRARVTCRRPARRRRRGPAARGIRRAHRARHRERRLERHRFRPADPSSGAEGASRGGEDSRRCRAARAASADRHQAGRRPGAHRLRGALRPQDVCAFGTGALVGGRDIFLRARQSTTAAARWIS